MPDDFDYVHELLKAKKYEEVLDLVYDPQGANLRPEYEFDRNHGWYVVGDCKFKLGELQDALTAFERALEERPDDVDALRAVAECYSEMADFQSAERTLRTALEIDPNSPVLAYNLANAHMDQKKFGDAIFLYRNIINNPDKKLAQLAQKNLRRAEREFSKGTD